MEKLVKIGELVETVDKTTEPRINCRRIAGEFYKVGDPTVENSGHCYLINNKYYKYNTGYIVFDQRLKKYVIKNNADLIQGVTGIGEDGKVVLGYFSKEINEIYPTIILGQRGEEGTYIVLDDSVLEGSDYLEELASGNYYHRKALPTRSFMTPTRVNDNVKRNLPYDSRGITTAYMAKHDKLYNPKYNATVEQFGGFLKDLTFGAEFETTKGFIPDRISSKLGLIALRDGSIGGLEYATIPLKGKKGVQTLVDSIQELEKRTTYDDNCSIHFHIGGIPRTEEFFIAFYKVLCAIQSQMYALFPLFKQYNFGVKRKLYTKPLPIESTVMIMDGVINKANIKSNFEILYSFLSMGQSYKDLGSDLSKVTHHPSDPHGNSKWNIRSRYHWVNLIPLLFGNKQTVEFRLHTPTYDTDKILNYLILCSSIVNYVKDNTTEILTNPNSISTLNLSDMIYSNCNSIGKDGSYNELAESCYNYIARRRDAVFSQSCSGDIKGDESKIPSRSYVRWANNVKTPSLGKFKTSNSGYGNNMLDRLAGIEQNIVMGRVGRDPVAVAVPGGNRNIWRDVHVNPPAEVRADE